MNDFKGDMQTEYDVLIIGGGPIGLACGIAAKEAGLTYLILEKGCLVNSLFNYPKNMTFFSTSERLEIGGIPFMTTQPKPKRDDALEYYRRVQVAYNLNIHLFEQVLSVDWDGGESFKVQSSEDVYRAKNVIVATGFFDIPQLMGVPGEDLPKVTHYYDEPHYYAGQRVVVVGASNSAIDAALETYRKGAEVTLVIRGPEVGQRVKYWVRPDIMNRIADGDIQVFYNSTIESIAHKEVVINTPRGKVELPNDFVIAMTGYQPDFQFLEEMGVQLIGDKKIPAHDPESMETNIPGLYLAGVVCGGMDTHVWFIENSRVHADKIMGQISNKGSMK